MREKRRIWALNKNRTRSVITDFGLYSTDSRLLILEMEATAPMRPVKMKLRSSRGASITYALLIFLVCAVVSSIVIVSASTAGGRMSGLKETDQRSIAATTAARQLQEKLDGKSVKFTYNKADNSYTLVSCEPSDANDILKGASWAVLSKGTYTRENPWKAEIKTWDATYTCNITPSLNNGLLDFTITASGGTARSSGIYTLDIIFTPNLKEPETGENLRNAKATVSWSLNSLSKGRATQAAPTTNP